DASAKSLGKVQGNGPGNTGCPAPPRGGPASALDRPGRYLVARRPLKPAVGLPIGSSFSLLRDILEILRASARPGSSSAMSMKRREFITLLGGAATTWPLAARAQQQVMPVIGVLSASTPADRSYVVTAFRRGVRESGYVEGQNVTIEYRWAQDQYDQLPDLAADLVRRQVAVIAAADTPSATAAKAATSTIPIVFITGGDPVQMGLVASLNRPGGNVTGISFMVATVGAKQLGLLHELLPGAVRIAALVDPHFPLTEPFVSDVRAAASVIGKKIEVLPASTGRDINTAFANFAQKPIDALLVGPGPL